MRANEGHLLTEGWNTSAKGQPEIARKSVHVRLVFLVFGGRAAEGIVAVVSWILSLNLYIDYSFIDFRVMLQLQKGR